MKISWGSLFLLWDWKSALYLSWKANGSPVLLGLAYSDWCACMLSFSAASMDQRRPVSRLAGVEALATPAIVRRRSCLASSAATVVLRPTAATSTIWPPAVVSVSWRRPTSSTSVRNSVLPSSSSDRESASCRVVETRTRAVNVSDLLHVTYRTYLLVSWLYATTSTAHFLRPFQSNWSSTTVSHRHILSRENCARNLNF